MKKTVLGIVVIGSVIGLSGCAEPGAKKRVYTASQEAYECGTKTVVIDRDPKTMYSYSTKEFEKALKYGEVEAKLDRKTEIAGLITVYDWPADPETTYWLKDGSFNKPIPVDTAGRPRPDETWSFRKQPNGKYYYGFMKYPNTSNFLTGHWCKRIH